MIKRFQIFITRAIEFSLYTFDWHVVFPLKTEEIASSTITGATETAYNREPVAQRHQMVSSLSQLLPCITVFKLQISVHKHFTSIISLLLLGVTITSVITTSDCELFASESISAASSTSSGSSQRLYRREREREINGNERERNKWK